MTLTIKLEREGKESQVSTTTFTDKAIQKFGEESLIEGALNKFMQSLDQRARKLFSVELDTSKGIVIHKGKIKPIESGTIIVYATDEEFLQDFENANNFLSIQESPTDYTELTPTTNPDIIKKFLSNETEEEEKRRKHKEDEEYLKGYWNF